MKRSLIGLGAALFVAALALTLFTFGLFDTAEAPSVSMEATAPTDFVQKGYLSFDAPGNQQDTMYLVYEAPGAPALTKMLILDAYSVCGSYSGAVPCMAMSVTFSTAFAGKRALVEGNLEGDAVRVRKLFVVDEGQEPILYAPGRVFIPWMQALRLLESCEVATVMQTHALDVHLSLLDGREVVAVEPVIDEVFRVLARTESVCGAIPMATE